MTTARTAIGSGILGKQRNGPIGIGRLGFLGQYARFENLAQPGSH